MSQAELEKILFLDIETVPLVYRYSDLDQALRDLWDRKWQHNRDISPEEQYSKAGIYAEFAKVVCISYGFIENGALRVEAISSEDEKEVLTKFAALLNGRFGRAGQLLCAHNGKEFDFPFLCRRLLINAMPLPRVLQIQGKKPWDVPHLDTLDMWKFGDYKHYSSLSLLAHVFGIPSPKDDMDGSMVGKTFYEDRDLRRIEEYCKKDVLTLVKVFCRFSGVEVPTAHDAIFA